MSFVTMSGDTAHAEQYLRKLHATPAHAHSAILE